MDVRITNLAAGAHKIFPDLEHLENEAFVCKLEQKYGDIPVYGDIMVVKKQDTTPKQLQEYQRAKNLMIRLVTVCFEPIRRKP